jgi:carboxypeptidase PM20D1
MIILYAVIAILLLLAAIMAVNTLYKRPKKRQAVSLNRIALDKDEIAQHLSGMIKFKTITSYNMEDLDREAFLGFHRYLEETYPLTHKTLEKEVVNEYGLLYKWKGTGSEKKPFLLMAHMDVVPVDDRTADKWKHPAFSGEIADGYVWGRGTIDMKGQLAALMESVEYLLEQGFGPSRDIYVALGFDEESMGSLGAQRIAGLLEQRGVRFDFVLDEGGVFFDGREMGIKAMVAAIGICEKGYADIRLTAESAGGHASKPPKQTAVGALSKAIVALEKHQMKPKLNSALRLMLERVGGYMKFPLNVIAANLQLTKPLLLKAFVSRPSGAAMVRTTTAPTMLKGSSAPNVLAEKAEVNINFRISPADSMDELLRHIKKTAGSGVKAEAAVYPHPSRVSSTESEAYGIIEQTAREMFGEHLITPYLMVATTDSRWFGKISDGIYQFEPFRSLSEDYTKIHAAGERLAVDSLCEGVEYFIRLVKRAAE